MHQHFNCQILDGEHSTCLRAEFFNGIGAELT